MKIALVGYGKMGKIIEGVATARRHEVVARFDIDNNVDGAGLTAESLAGGKTCDGGFGRWVFDHALQ